MDELNRDELAIGYDITDEEAYEILNPIPMRHCSVCEQDTERGRGCLLEAHGVFPDGVRRDRVPFDASTSIRASTAARGSVRSTTSGATRSAAPGAAGSPCGAHATGPSRAGRGTRDRAPR